MPAFPLYNALLKIGIDKDTAQEVVDNVAHVNDVVTKADLQAEMAKLEMRLTNKIYGLGITIIIVVVGGFIASVSWIARLLLSYPMGG